MWGGGSRPPSPPGCPLMSLRDKDRLRDRESLTTSNILFAYSIYLLAQSFRSTIYDAGHLITIFNENHNLKFECTHKWPYIQWLYTEAEYAIIKPLKLVGPFRALTHLIMRLIVSTGILRRL